MSAVVSGMHERIRYPKLTLLVLSFVTALFLLSESATPYVDRILSSLGLSGIFLAGVFYSYGFTAAPSAAALLLMAKEFDIVLAGLLAGFGALLSDLVIFLFIRHSLKDEIDRLSKESLMIKADSYMKGFRKFLLLPLAGFLIASPLPTEIGVALLASTKEVSLAKFAVIAYLLHTTGIFIILLIGNAI